MNDATTQSTQTAQDGTHTTISAPTSVTNQAMSEFTFNFRKNAELGTKRAAVTVQLPFLTLQGLIDIINAGDEKQVALVLETLRQPVIDQAKAQVDDNEAITQDTLDLSKLSWAAISALEPAARRGGGIPKEVWEAFVVDYIAVMPTVVNRTVEQVTRAATLLANKLSACKGNKPVLSFLRSQLDLYFAATSKAEEFVSCYEFLINKADSLLQADDAELLKNL